MKKLKMFKVKLMVKLYAYFSKISVFVINLYIKYQTKKS